MSLKNYNRGGLILDYLTLCNVGFFLELRHCEEGRNNSGVLNTVTSFCLHHEQEYDMNTNWFSGVQHEYILKNISLYS